MSTTVELLEAAVRKRLKRHAKNDPRIWKAFEEARRRFLAKPLLAHNWEHTLRDTFNALVLLKTEKANPSIVLPAIVFHDVGFLHPQGAIGKTHADVGARMAPEIFPPLGFSDDETRHIAACIRTHKGSTHDEVPESLEAKVVTDADMLEKFGPLGVVQVLRTYCEFNWGPDEMLQRAQKGVGDRRFETPTGQKLADRRRPFTVRFYASYNKAYAKYLK